jgi:chromosome segregation ATPase
MDERLIKPGENEAMEAAVRAEGEDPLRCCRCGQPWVMASFVAYHCHLHLEEWRFCTRHCMAKWLEEQDAGVEEVERYPKIQQTLLKQREDLREAKKKISNLQGQVTRWRNKDTTGMKELEEKVKDLKKEVFSLMDELTQVQEKGWKGDDRLQQTREVNETLQHENETLWQRVQVLEDEITGLKQEVERLKPFEVQVQLRELR